MARHLSSLSRSILLLAGMLVMLVAVGWFLAGGPGLLLALVALAFLVLGMPHVPPAWLLQAMKARPLHPAMAPGLYLGLEAIAEKAGLSRLPRLYLLPSDQLNAFALGRRGDAALAVTEGLVRRLTPRQLIGVLAHEVAHIKHHDLTVMSIAMVINRVTYYLSLLGQLLLLLNLPLLLMGNVGISWLVILVMIATPYASALLQLALSREREFKADRTAARLTGDPLGLAEALAELERGTFLPWERLFPGTPGTGLPRWLSTHPSTRERIRLLRQMAGKGLGGHRGGGCQDAVPVRLIRGAQHPPVVLGRRSWHGV